MDLEQDVVLHVPMESMKDVERVKQALAIAGALISLHCFSLHRLQFGDNLGVSFQLIICVLDHCRGHLLFVEPGIPTPKVDVDLVLQIRSTQRKKVTLVCTPAVERSVMEYQN